MLLFDDAKVHEKTDSIKFLQRIGQILQRKSKRPGFETFYISISLDTLIYVFKAYTVDIPTSNQRRTNDLATFYFLSLITKTQREPMRKLTPETIIIVD